MASSDRWRILIGANNAGQTGFDEIEMASSPGGTNLATGGTASASTTYGGFYAPDKAFNGDATGATGEWAGSGGFLQWIEYQLTAAADIVEMRIAPLSGDMNGTPRIMFFQQYDGSAWVTEWIGVFDGWVNSVLTTFTKPAASATAQVWGIVNTGGAVIPGYLDTDIKEFVMALTPGGSTVTSGGTAGAWRNNTDAGNAFDGSTGTLWYASGSQHTAIFYDFGSGNDQTIAEYRFLADSSLDNENRAPGTGFIVFGSDARSFGITQAYAIGLVDYVADIATLTIGGGPPPVTGRRRQGCVVT